LIIANNSLTTYTHAADNYSNTVKLFVRNTKAYANAIGSGTATKFYYNAGARWSRTGVDGCC